MFHAHLFIDGSVHPQSGIGYGAYLMISNLEMASFEMPTDMLKQRVSVKRFESTTSTQLELQNLLWAIAADESIVGASPEEITLSIYSDSQNIINLPSRRLHLEKYDYFSKNHKRIANYQLYQAFYRLIDQYTCEFVKVKGHQPSRQKDRVAQFFGCVDQSARSALRNDVAAQQSNRGQITPSD